MKDSLAFCCCGMQDWQWCGREEWLLGFESFRNEFVVIAMKLRRKFFWWWRWKERVLAYRSQLEVPQTPRYLRHCPPANTADVRTKFSLLFRAVNFGATNSMPFGGCLSRDTY